MNKGLSRRTVFLDDNDIVNVYELLTKQIVFCGNISDVANFLGITQFHASAVLRRKSRFRKKYALRRKPNL